MDPKTEVQDFVDELLRKFKNNSFLGDRAAGAHSKLSNVASSFQTATKNMTKNMVAMTATVDHLNHSIRNILGAGVLGGIFEVVVDAGENLVKHYRQLTNVGQSFGGSMFAMAEAAGASGQSMEEFTRTIERNSVVAAGMAAHAQGNVSAFTLLEKGVRNSLRQFGFYGMTIEELDDLTGDYMNTLKSSMFMERTGTQERQNDIDELAKNASQLANAFGANRRELLKSVQEAMNDPNVLSQLITPQQQQSGKLAAQLFEAIGGKDIGQGFLKAAGSYLGILDVKHVQIAQDFNKLGLGNEQQALGGMIKEVLAGRKVEPAQQLTFFKNLVDRYNNGGLRETLKALEQNDETRDSATRIEAMIHSAQQWVGTTDEYNTSLKNLTKEINNKLDPLTIAVTTFTDQFHNIIGGFQEGFFGSLVKSLIGSNQPTPEQTETAIKNLTETIKAIGSVFGSVIGDVLANIDPVGIKNGLTLFFDTLKTIFKVIGYIRDGITKFTGMGNLGADAVLVAVAWWGKRIIGAFFKALFQKSIFNVARATINVAGGGVGGGFGGRRGGGGDEIIGGGSSSAREEAEKAFRKPTVVETFKQRGVWAATKDVVSKTVGSGGWMRSAAGALTGLIAGAITGIITEKVADHIQTMVGLPEGVKDIIDPIAGIAGALLGPALITTVGEGIVGGIAAIGAIPLAVGAAIAAAVVGGGFAYNAMVDSVNKTVEDKFGKDSPLKINPLTGEQDTFKLSPEQEDKLDKISQQKPKSFLQMFGIGLNADTAPTSPNGFLDPGLTPPASIAPTTSAPVTPAAPTNGFLDPGVTGAPILTPTLFDLLDLSDQFAQTIPSIISPLLQSAFPDITTLTAPAIDIQKSVDDQSSNIEEHHSDQTSKLDEHTSLLTRMVESLEKLVGINTAQAKLQDTTNDKLDDAGKTSSLFKHY